MIAALSLSAWRAQGRHQFWSVLAALAVGIHIIAMAAHQPPATALALFDDPHALCLSSDDGSGVPSQDPASPLHHAPPCTICQSLHAAVPPSQAPALAATPWAVAQAVDPPALAAPAPRLVLTDLNPRGPPSLG